MVRQADLARPRSAATAHEGDVRNRVMRRAEGALGQEADAGTQLSRDRVNGRRFNRFFERQWRKNAGESPGEHGLAAARRPNHQQVVSARCGHFERTPGEGLAVHVG